MQGAIKRQKDAGWSSLVARWAHNPKVAGSNPAPATNSPPSMGVFYFYGFTTMETIHLHIEKKSRRGKTVTVLDGFTRDYIQMERLAGQFKKACGTGGTFKDGSIELQGDLRLKVRELLLKEGFKVKG